MSRDVTCPFCSLHCDDLVIRNSSGKLNIEKGACAIATRQFERNDPHASPSVFGKKTSLEDALERAANILGESRQAHFAGSASDVNACRSLLNLADKVGASIDHVHGDAMTSNLRVLQTRGWITTTLAELKNRADLIIFVGTDASTRYPRFFERFVWNQASLAGLKRNTRQLFYIGEGLDTTKGISPKGNKPTLIPCSGKSINETLLLLRALLENSKVDETEIDKKVLKNLNSLSEQIKQADYGVIIWDPAEFSASDGELSVQVISDMLRKLNKKQRFAGLSLGGNDGGTSFTSVCSWQSGFPLRVSFRDAYPAHDIFRFSTSRILEENNSDSLLWLNNFDTSLVVPSTKVPRIVLSRPLRRVSEDIAVYIPLATPGLDHRGNLMRTDSVVSLPLSKLRESAFPTASEVLDKLRQLV